MANALTDQEKMVHDPGTLYRIYLDQEFDLSSIYGFRRAAEDGRKYQTRYFTDAGKDAYEEEMRLIGITELEFAVAE